MLGFRNPALDRVAHPDTGLHDAIHWKLLKYDVSHRLYQLIMADKWFIGRREHWDDVCVPYLCQFHGFGVGYNEGLIGLVGQCYPCLNGRGWHDCVKQCVHFVSVLIG